MKNFILAIVLSLCCGFASAKDLVYEGVWITNKGRDLTGTMKCVVKERFSKKYRVPILDEKLTKTRIH